MKIQIEASKPRSISIESDNDSMEIDTNTNVIGLMTSNGDKFKLYERNGEIEIAHEGKVVWTSYDTSDDTWKDWGPKK